MPSSSPTRPARTPRLGIEDWTGRALALLMEEGVRAIKVSRLCADLGVTKGSFYWHFADVEALMAAVAERWIAETRAAHEQLATLEGLPPLERIRAMAVRLTDDRSARIERALREWALSDDRVAAMIVESDRVVFGLIQSALLELGHTAADARLRAGLLVYAGIGFAHGQESLPTPTVDDIDALVAFLAGDSAR